MTGQGDRGSSGATLVRDKEGFTVTDEKGGEPVYTGGVRGAVERNAVRYYLAVKATWIRSDFTKGSALSGA